MKRKFFNLFSIFLIYLKVSKCWSLYVCFCLSAKESNFWTLSNITCYCSFACGS